MSGVAQRLRQKLLDLAIRGKLVPQDEKDEPAETLLARIRAERFQTGLSGLTGLGKDGRVEVERCRKGRACRFATAAPISDDEKPFDLPKGWCWCRLGGITTKVGAGSTPQGGKKVYLASGVKFIREQNVYCDGLHNDGMAFIDEVTNQRMSGTIVCPGDMLMNITGGSIGRTALVPDDFDIGNVNQHVLIIRAAEPETRKYIHLVLCSPLILRLMFSRQTGDKPGLSAEKVKAFPIPLPPLAEQKRIVAALDGMLAAADAVAAGTEKIAALKEKARAKILDLAIRGKLVKQDKNDEPAEELLKRIRRGEVAAPLTQRAQSSQRGAESLDRINRIHRIEGEGVEASLRFSAPFAFSASAPAGKKRNPVNPVNPVKQYPLITDDEKPFDLPKGWCWCRLGDIAVKVVDGDHNPPKGCGQITDYYMISSLNVNCNRLVDLDRVRYLSAEQHNDCDKRTAVREGDILLTTVASLGRSCIFDGSIRVTCQRSVSVVNTLVDNRYVKVCFDSPYFQRMMQTESKGTAQKGFYLNQLVSAPIPLPPLAEQKRIVAKVDEMLVACDALTGGVRGA